MANLFIACETGDTKKVKEMILRDKALLNVRNAMRANATPFMAAAGKGQIKTCKNLLAMKADINAEDNFEWTALNWATSEQDKKMIEFLEENGAELGDGDMDEDDED